MTFEHAEMSDAQSDAVKAAYDRLGEHFDNVVIVLAWDTGDKEGNEAWVSYYKGGYVAACGLLGLALGKSGKFDGNEENEPT